jgi:uncharacterized protein YmfQ (DUF2313 family)
MVMGSDYDCIIWETLTTLEGPSAATATNISRQDAKFAKYNSAFLGARCAFARE